MSTRFAKKFDSREDGFQMIIGDQTRMAERSRPETVVIQVDLTIR